MSLQLNITPGSKVLELGGGANPMIIPHVAGGPPGHLNVDARQCADASGRRMVDFTCDFEQFPFPIGADEFDAVICKFCLEHVSFTNTRKFIGEIFRVLKDGGKAVIVVPNTEAQMRWIQGHGEGWDGKGLFDAASENLFGSQDYKENAHRAYFSPQVAAQLFQEAGFESIVISPFGERATDMLVEAKTPILDGKLAEQAVKPEAIPAAPANPPLPMDTAEQREAVFDRHYFDGGHYGGGYGSPGYCDFPAHEITVGHILARKPGSMLELGCSRGYLTKRLNDRGVFAVGLDISRHCQLTRVCDNAVQHDICLGDWSPKLFTSGSSEGREHEFGGDYKFDLAVSIAMLEHIPEQFVPVIAAELEKTCKRGLHGIDFGTGSPGTDRTKVTLRPKEWWQRMLPPGHEVVPKNDLENGPFPEDVIKGDGKVKLNIGSFTNMFHHGWKNIDIHDLSQHAQSSRYDFQRVDVRHGLPYNTATVDLVFSHHFFEHLSYADGLQFLRECRRVIKPDGAMRFAVPDAGFLMDLYANGGKDPLSGFDEMNHACADAATSAGKLWELLHEGHAATYDTQTMIQQMEAAGFVAVRSRFRRTNDVGIRQILRETTEMEFAELSLFIDAVPNVEKKE